MESNLKDLNISKGYVLNSVSILKKSTIDQKVLSYQGIRYNQFLLCGFVVKYEETDKKTTITLWDSAGGIVDISFFNQNETDKNFGLINFNYKYKCSAMVFAKVSVKDTDKKPLLFYTGVKVSNISIEDILYHKMNLLHCWGKLTGLIPSEVDDEKPVSVLEASNTKGKGEVDLLKIIELIEKKKGSCTVSDIIKETGEDKHKVDLWINDLVEVSAIYIDQGIINII